MSCCNYDEEKAKDLMQTVYVNILNQKAIFDGRSSLRTWLYAVIRRISWQLYRKENSIERLREKIANLMARDNDCPDFGEARDRKITAQFVLEALSVLPGMQRQVVELIYYRGMTLAEAVGVLDISSGSASTHLHWAKKTLRKKLRKLQD